MPYKCPINSDAEKTLLDNKLSEIFLLDNTCPISEQISINQALQLAADDLGYSLRKAQRIYKTILKSK